MVLNIIGIILLILVIIILIGPRVKINTKIKPVHLPFDLDTYLAQKEADIPNLISGTEKKIIWAGEKRKKTEYSIIYIHGFTATRQETVPVAGRVAKAICANLFYTRLKGHGRDAEAMAEPEINDWINDVWEAYEIGRRIGNKVIVFGVSMGAVLGTWLCTKADNIAALLILSANFEPAEKAAQLVLLPWGFLIVKILLGKYYTQFEPLNQDHEKYWTPRYPSGAILTMMATCKLGSRAILGNIKVPVLSLYTENDRAISLPSLHKAIDRMGTTIKKNINIKEAKDHIIAGNIVSPETNEIVISYITDFLKRVI